MVVAPHYLLSLSRMLLILSFMVWLASTTSSSTTNFTDQTALLSFKAQIDSHDPNNLLANNWTTSRATFCNWIGVSCSLRRQRVTALNLSSMALQGTISPLLSNLSFLVILDLSNNSFHGHIPDELGHLRRLRIIRISINQLEGQIPQSLSQCGELEEISMAYNQLGGEVPSWFDNLPKLRFLYLGANNLVGSIPTSIWNITSLEVLELAWNPLHGEIPMQLRNLRNLAELYSSNNSLTGTIPCWLGNLPQLRILYLGENDLTGSIPPSMGNITRLEELYLEGNRLHGEIPKQLEYGWEGRVSTGGDVYSYGILLMETFTRKKPTNEMFVGLSSLRQWVNASFPHSVREVMDVNLLREEGLVITQCCISAIFELALLCSRESPEERTNMKEVVVKLTKIKQ